MKTLLVITTALLMSTGLSAQTTKAPAKKTSTSSAKGKTAAKGKKSSKGVKIKTSEGSEFDEVICYENGPCTFNILKKDTLVYEVNAAGKQYNLFIIPNKFQANTIADFNWKTTGSDPKSGHVVINASALNAGKRYLMDFPGGELKLTDASAVWLSNVNFKEVTKGETAITFDGSTSENFKSPEADAVSADVNYKGKQMSLEGFSIENKPEGEAGRKEVWVLNISTNLLILKLDNGAYSIMLKEVRQRKGM
jgi:hypothetical protein